MCYFLAVICCHGSELQPCEDIQKKRKNCESLQLNILVSNKKKGDVESHQTNRAVVLATVRVPAAMAQKGHENELYLGAELPEVGWLGVLDGR